LRSATVGSGAPGAPSHRAAWWPTLTGLAGPVAAALLLPPPAGQVALLADPRPDAVVGAVAVLVATSVTYLLAAWSVTVCAAVVCARLPGVIGLAARRVLRGITPTVMRRVVMTAAGLSIAAGLTACGTSAAAGEPVPLAPAVTMSTVIDAPPAALSDQGAGTRSPLNVSLDWPTTTGAADQTAGAVRPDDGATPTMTESSASTPTAASGTVAADDPSTASDASADLASESATPAFGAAADPAESPTSPIEEPTSPIEEPASTAEEPPSVTSDATAPRADPARVTVRAGDSLWSIAADHLPAEATAAQIDAAWHEWYQANHDVIGDDPNLIRPGQVLAAPGSAVFTSPPTSPDEELPR
jgi:LysM repeat protein